MNLNEWAIKWSIPFEAVEDLRRQFEGVQTDPYLGVPTGESEAAVQTRIRLESSRKGLRLFRNNVGAAYMQDGSFIRYGLANDSKQINDTVKSSDLIGIRPLLITKNHTGMIVGQFVARECKRQGWTYSGTKPEKAQLRFLELVAALGGDACFANDEGTI